MRNLLIIILSFSLMFISISISAQSVKIEPSTIKHQDKNGKYFYMHHVRKGETLYGISKAYKVPIDSITANNKDISNGIKIDQEIKIPIFSAKNIIRVGNIPTDTIAPKGFKYHIVKKGETLFRIAYNYQVSIDDLKKYNPKLSINIQPGDYILIPQPDLQKQVIAESKYDSLIDYKIGWFDNYYRLQRKFKLNKEQLEQLNPQLIKEGVRRGLIIKVPVLDKKDSIPEYKEIVLDTVEMEVIHNDIDTLPIDCKTMKYNSHVYKIGLMLPLYSNLEKDIKVNNAYRIKEIKEYPSFRFIEFYQGALLALDSLKNMGFKAELYVWDTRANTNTTDSICSLEAFQDLDMVIGPLFTKNVNIVRSYSKEYNIQLVDIFNKNNYSEDSMYQHFELRTTNYGRLNTISNYINDSLYKSQVYIIHEGRPSEIKALNELTISLSYPDTFIDSNRIHIFRYQDGGLKTIINSFKADHSYVIINLVQNEARISNFLRQINNKKSKDIRPKKNKKNYEIIVVDPLYKWAKYKTLDIKYLNDLKYTYTTDYFIDYEDSMLIIPYNNKFYNTYKRVPSKLGYIGYDVFWFFGNALFDYGINYSMCIEHFTYKQMYNCFKMKRVNKSLYRNNTTNIIQYNNFRISKKN